MVFVDEGYIKFNIDWKVCPTEAFLDFKALNSWRQKLMDKGLVGVYPNGIGFGNLSCRIPASNRFFITGSATGSIPVLSLEQYTKVCAFDFEKNMIACEGKIKASSESLTHAAVYSACPTANAVFHAHNNLLWKHLLSTLPSTSPAAPHDSPEMANEVLRLFKETNVSTRKIFAMGGHEEGVVSFGSSLDEAGSVLLKHLAALS